MKKIKNIESKTNDNQLEHVREGKIAKDKKEKAKNLKRSLSQIDDLNLTPKTKSSNLQLDNVNKIGKNKKKKLKSNEQETNQKSAEDLGKVINEGKKTKNKEGKKQKNSQKNELKNIQIESPSKELTEADLNKIAKKKAKKLAQKLKKSQKKAENKIKTSSSTDTTDSSPKSKIVNATVAKSLGPISTKVLAKKENKAQKRQLIKDQKLAEKPKRDPVLENATVFVGNLPVSTKRVQLARLFKDFGPVNCIRIRSAGGKVIFKHKQRKASGSLNAYIVLKDKETAEKAVSLNGIEFKGHHLRVTLSTITSRQHEDKKTVFVGNLKYSATEESLHEIFSSCGEIDYIRCIRDGDKGCKGVAYVCFKTADAVGLALELNETIVDDRPIHVERFNTKKLGAKKAREDENEKEISKKSAKQKPNAKNGKKDSTVGKKQNRTEADDVKKPKKSEFRGVKVEGLKKKQKSKKKKSNDPKLQLVKKIAPKIKNE